MIVGRGAPCKNCEDRVLKCHASCNRYLSYQKEAADIKEKIEKDNQLDRFRKDQIARERAIKLKKKGRKYDFYWD